MKTLSAGTFSFKSSHCSDYWVIVQGHGLNAQKLMARSWKTTYLEFLTTGKYSDLIIQCQEVEFKVHRIIVCTRSEMLDKACGGPFQVCLSPQSSYDFC